MTTTFSLADLAAMPQTERNGLYAWINQYAATHQSNAAASSSASNGKSSNRHPTMEMAEGMATGKPFRLDMRKDDWKKDKAAMEDRGWKWHSGERAMVPPDFVAG